MPTPFTPLAPLTAARMFIEKFQTPACLLIAVSGGSDSIGLLLALHETVQKSGRRDISLQAVTIDHALRAESAEEARVVAAFCARLGIPHHIRRWNGEKPSTGISAAARLARYALIADVAEKIGADAIVVGHTHGDQQETIAMRNGRSARADNLGLSGMADAVLYHSRHWILRPFLAVTRADIRNYLQDIGETWIDDPSNDDRKYERVRVRHALSAGSDNKTLGEVRGSISARAAEWIERFVTAHSLIIIEIDPAGVNEDAAVLRHALSALSSVVGGRSFGLASETMDRVMAFALSGEAGRMTASRTVFDRRSGGLFLYRESRDVEVLMLPAKESKVWDGRFEITNSLSQEVVVRGGDEAACDIVLSAKLPRGVIKRAFLSAPVIETGEERQSALTMTGISTQPVLAPYDLFLPRFDLELASCIAKLFKREAYPQLPV